MNLSATIAKMKASGMTGDAIALALECLVFDGNGMNTVTRNSVTPVTPAALRMRRMRDRKANETNVLDAEKAASVDVSERNDGVTERNESVTTYNNLSSLEVEIKEDKKESIVRNVTRKRNSYAEAFESFWLAFPTDAGMSKLEAAKAWDKLTPDEQGQAIAAIPAFKAWVAKQGTTYRIVHACRFLSQKRFEGFKPDIQSEAAAGTRVYVKAGTDAFDAWDDYYKRTKSKLAPRDQRGGWWFDTEYPSSKERAA